VCETIRRTFRTLSSKVPETQRLGEWERDGRSLRKSSTREMDTIVQGVRRRGTDGIPSVSGKVSEKFRLAEPKRVDHVFRIGSTCQIRAHCSSSPKICKLLEKSVILKVSGSKRFYWRNPSVSYMVGQTVCLDESESIGVVEAVGLGDLEHGEGVRNRISG